MSVTLKQIADMAGVHKSTVDKVIHDRPGVSEAKREQIRALLKEYGYESNPLAKALNYQKKKLVVGVLLTGQAVPDLLRGVERVRPDFSGFNITLDLRQADAADTKAQAAVLREFRESGAAGVAACVSSGEEVENELSTLHEAGIPLILVHHAPENAPCLCRIEQNAQQAGRTAARMLALLLGSEGKLGILRIPGERTPAEQAFADALPVGIELAEAAETKPSPKLAYMNTRALLTRCPELDALFITCGCVPEVCRAIRDAKPAKRPRLLCMENSSEISALVREGEVACAVSADHAEQGRLALRLLFEHLVYERTPEENEICTPSLITLAENV